MAKLQGTILASKIVPTDSLDTYATHEDKYGRGGHRSVDTIVERDEITTPRRKEGMTVYVKENKTKYILEGGIENTNWKVDSSGVSSGGSVDLSEYYKKTETYNKIEVDTKIADIHETDLSGYYDKTETYNKSEVDNIINNIPATDLSNYYDKTQTETLLSNKVDKVTGKGLSTNDFSDTFKQALELKKVQDISTNSVAKKLVVAYTDGTFVDLNLDDIVTDVKVEGATLDATTSVLTIVSSDGGADVTVDLSVFVTNQTLSNTLVGKADKIHTHSTSDIDGLDISLSNKVTKNVAIVGDTKTKITYDSKGLVVSGADLLDSDIPNLPQSKITNLETNLASKIDKGIGVVGATKAKITYNNDGIITGGADLVEADLPNISQAKITNLVSDLSNKQDTLVSGTNIKTINGQSVLGNGNIFVTALGSSVALGEYGVRWNQETDIYEALGSVHRTQIQGNMKRCVLKDDGTVNYYLNPTNSTQKDQGEAADLTGADGNVMVEVPKFWYKHTLVVDTHEWWISNTPLEGYSVHPWFLEGGVERPFRYYRAYTCTNVAGKLRSISGSTPTRSQTRATFRTQARANGTGWGLCSWNAVNAIRLLFLTEYCTFNSQAVLGKGNDTGNDYGITTGQSNSIGNGSSGASNNDMWMSYRGIENWYADCWEFVDGINVQNYKVFLSQNPATFADDVFTGYYVDSEITIPAMSSSYIKKISGEFLPTAVGGSSSTYITDAGWWGTGNRVVLFGGNSGNGLGCGAFALNASAPSLANALIGSGLSR